MSQLFVWTVLVAGIAFGADRAWAFSLSAILFAGFGLVWAYSVAMSFNQKSIVLPGLKLSGALFIVPVIWAIFQASGAMPAAWLHPFWALSDSYWQASSMAAMSVDPHATLTGLLRLLSYGLVFFLSVQWHRSSQQAATTFKCISYAGFGYAVYGLVIYLGGFNTVLWFDKWSYRDLVTSTFINRNSYATYAGLTLLAVMPQLFNALQSALKYGLGSHYGRQYFAENLLKRGWRPLLLVIFIATALLLTQSRGGFLSTSLALIVLMGLLQLSRKLQGHRAVSLFVLLMAVCTLAVFERSGDQVVERLDTISLTNNGRLIVYDLINQVNQQQQLGLGYGSFKQAFRLYRNESVVGFFDLAHNTYLENRFELGFWPSMALFMAIGWQMLRCVRGVWVRQRDWIYPATGVSASVLVGAHALVDFSLQIPAVGYLYALMLGVAVAQSYSSKINV